MKKDYKAEGAILVVEQLQSLLSKGYSITVKESLGEIHFIAVPNSPLRQVFNVYGRSLEEVVEKISRS